MRAAKYGYRLPSCDWSATYHVRRTDGGPEANCHGRVHILLAVLDDKVASVNCQHRTLHTRVGDDAVLFEVGNQLLVGLAVGSPSHDGE